MKQYEVSKLLSTAERFAALSRVGAALMSEMEEARLLHLIAQTACDLTGAAFAAFSLRPIDEEGQPLVPSEGNLFHLAAVVGVTPEQEALFRRMPLGGEGLLAPIFRHGVPVRVADVLRFLDEPGHFEPASSGEMSLEPRDAARQAAYEYVQGTLAKEDLRSLGIPRGHPVVRSFLGVPLLDHSGEVRGGLLLGHMEPDQFTHEDEALLVGLAAQAAVALENARLYHMAHMRAQELNAIFESITDGVTLFDRHGSILHENDAARRLRESLQARPEGKQAIEALLQTPAQRALSGEVVRDIIVSLTHGGEEVREYVVSASPLRLPAMSSGPLPKVEESSNSASHSVPRAVVVWHEVTESRRLLFERQARVETEARLASLQLILDELPGSVYLVRGPDARLVLANRATLTVLGAPWPQDQPLSEFLKESGIRIFGANGRKLTSSQLATLRAVRHGETIRQHQEIIRYPDGTTLPVLVNAVALDSHHLNSLQAQKEVSPVPGPEPLAIVMIQDVTSLKEAEHLKDEFIAIATHELRNPLAVVKGFAQTLFVQTKRGKGPELADWQMEAIQMIDQSTMRMVELIEDLLDVTRLQAGGLQLHLEPTDLIALAQRVAKRFQMVTEQHNLSVETSLEHLVVNIDSGRMEQVLANLISNAIKYSPAGGRVEVIIREEVETNAAVLSVSDSGIGIPAHQQAHIFGRFVRADNAHMHGIGGSGLGLYLCRELVERHDGRIWFESTEGNGSIFCIALPLPVDSKAI